jgi:hypothetical protein
MSVVQKNSSAATENNDKKSRRIRANGDGSIFKDKKRNRWVASFYDFKHVRRTSSFKKRADAEAWIGDQKEAKDRAEGTYAARPKQTVTYSELTTDHLSKSIASAEASASSIFAA